MSFRFKQVAAFVCGFLMVGALCVGSFYGTIAVIEWILGR